MRNHLFHSSGFRFCTKQKIIKYAITNINSDTNTAPPSHLKSSCLGSHLIAETTNASINTIPHTPQWIGLNSSSIRVLKSHPIITHGNDRITFRYKVFIHLFIFIYYNLLAWKFNIYKKSYHQIMAGYKFKSPLLIILHILFRTFVLPLDH